MKRFFLILACMLTFVTFPITAQEALYKNPKASVEARVADLLSRMTLEEKVGQMNQLIGIEHYKESSATIAAEDLSTNTASAYYPGSSLADMERWTRQGLVSSFLHVFTLEESNYLQQLNMQSRLQVPLMIGIDAIHGNARCQGNTVYPTNIGLASSFDVDLAYTIARQTAAEMRAMNIHWTFNPNIEVARDGRWGRCGETFGEDPYLVTQMGLATTRGYQGNLDSDSDVLACAKHFVGGSYSVNGTNGAPCDVSERTLRETFFPPFEASVRQGQCMSAMMSHNELNGIPCHTNYWLMDDVLRREWGFRGFVVSDWMDIEHCVDQHRTATDNKDAFLQSINAGIDMHMHGPEWQRAVVELVKEGKISESRIDESVRRILEVKFRLGLFEHPYGDIATRERVINNPEHKATALQASRNSIVLLKNTPPLSEGAGGRLLLPLDEIRYKRVLVTGINANDQNIMGDWSEPQPDDQVVTVLEGLRMTSPQTEFLFVDQGWDPRNMSQAKVDEAVAAAEQCDLNIVCCGEYMMRYRWSERTSGEDTDRDNLNLVGLQDQLIQRLNETGKPTIVVIISGRPLSVTYAAEHVPALINAWEPGQYGGQAIAEIIYGRYNPSAKLAMTMPRSVGQISTWYNHKTSAYFHPAVLSNNEPLYPYGYGLSYTHFAYSNLDVQPEGDHFLATVTVTNDGQREGTEIVQLYLRDQVSSVARPVKELKDFRRVHLQPGESQTLTFVITRDKLAFYDQQMQQVVEPGNFDVMIGGSSRDCDLLRQTFTVK